MIKDGFSTDMRITIVQPGVSISKLSTEMKQLLLSTEYYLSETYNIPLNCYFSEWEIVLKFEYSMLFMSMNLEWYKSLAS